MVEYMRHTQSIYTRDLTACSTVYVVGTGEGRPIVLAERVCQDQRRRKHINIGEGGGRLMAYGQDYLSTNIMTKKRVFALRNVN